MHPPKEWHHVLGVSLRHNRNKSDTAIERTQHLFFRDIAGLLKEGKNGRYLPAIFDDSCRAGLGKDTREVLHNPPARNMSKPVDREIPEETLDYWRVNLGGPQQLLSECDT